MPLSYEDHWNQIEADEKLNAARQDHTIGRFLAAAEKAADVVTKMEVTRMANLVARIDAEKSKDFLS